MGDENNDKPAGYGLDLGRFYLAFNRRFFIGLGLCGVIMLIAIANAKSAGEGVAAGVLVVGGCSHRRVLWPISKARQSFSDGPILC